MARISIWDMDFYYKKSFLPNPTLMKISSYHKQLGDLINFVTEEYHIFMPFDIYYIMRDNKLTPRLTTRLSDNEKVRLLGSTFKHHDNRWEINAVIAAVRPDYMLYPDKERDSYYNAQIVQFYFKGQRLELKQPFENTKKHHKKTLIIDKDFWDANNEDIIICLQELRKYNNISFLAPIKLKKIIENDEIRVLFKKLDFTPGTIFKFQNNFGSTYEEMLVLFDFFEELKLEHNHVSLGRIPIKTITLDHWANSKNAIDDLKRCLQIADEAKKRKINILLVGPNRRKFDTPYWYYFEILEVWTSYFPEYSYVEMMLHSSVKRMEIPWHAILNDTIKWGLPNTNFLLHIMSNYPDIIKNYGFRRWGDKFLESELINWNIVQKYKGIIREITEEEKIE